MKENSESVLTVGFRDRIRLILAWLSWRWIAFVYFAVCIGAALGIVWLVVVWVKDGLPGVGSNCSSCREECEELGRKLGAETTYAKRCWVKGWGTAP